MPSLPSRVPTWDTGDTIKLGACWSLFMELMCLVALAVWLYYCHSACQCTENAIFCNNLKFRQEAPESQSTSTRLKGWGALNNPCGTTSTSKSTPGWCTWASHTLLQAGGTWLEIAHLVHALSWVPDPLASLPPHEDKKMKFKIPEPAKWRQIAFMLTSLSRFPFFFQF